LAKCIFSPSLNRVGPYEIPSSLWSYSPDEMPWQGGSRDVNLKFWDSTNFTLVSRYVAHLYAIIIYLSRKWKSASHLPSMALKSIKNLGIARAKAF